MATDGTVETKTYNRYLEAHGIECIVPEPSFQKMVMEIIYGDIKIGKKADMEKFLCVAEHLRKKGAERIILGCTELSLVKKQAKLGREYVDSLEVLAKCAIEKCGKESVGFEL